MNSYNEKLRLPTNCKLCSANVTNSCTYSNLIGGDVIVTTCDNQHRYENSVDAFMKKWNCPVCKTDKFSLVAPDDGSGKMYNVCNNENCTAYNRYDQSPCLNILRRIRAVF